MMDMNNGQGIGTVGSINLENKQRVFNYLPSSVSI